MNLRNRNNTIELVLVLILLVVITVSIFLLVEGGSNSYNKILENKESFENARIAYSFINMKIKQNDYRDSITVKENVIDGEKALVITHNGVEEGLFTYLFYKDGFLYECYIDEFDEPSVAFSEKIVEVDELSFENYKTDEGIVVNTGYIFNNEMKHLYSITAFRTD